MALREFTDGGGNSWLVWETTPTNSTFVQAEFQHGWLTFEHAQWRRRLFPVPPGWEELPDEELRSLCAEARAETPRKRLVE